MRTTFASALLLAVSCLHSARGDVVELRNGTIVDGKYAGGTATTLRVETQEGVKVIPTGDVLALTFTAAAPGAPAAADSAAAPAAAPAASAVPPAEVAAP